VVHTYASLLRDDPRGRAAGEAVKKKRFSMSLFVIYFGLKTQHPQLQHHTVCFGPRYRELIGEIFKGPDLAQDFSLYLHAPTRTDPSLAPEGSEAFYVLAPVPHLGSGPNIDWESEGPRYRDRIFEYLEQRYIPNLRRDLVTSRIFTPYDFRDELNAHVGSAFSLEPILTQSAWFRTHNRDDKIQQPLLRRRGTHPGAGRARGVVGSAKATAALMLDDARMKLAS
jgi:phytoene desaturase